MKNLFFLIAGCTFLLSGSLGLAIVNLSEVILLTNECVSSNNLLYYLFVSFIPVGLILMILVFFKK